MKVTIENININVTGNLSDDMSDDEFFHFCTQNRDLRIERDANRQIYIMPPTGLDTGAFNADINTDLSIWNRINKNGKVFDSSTGFTLPDRAVFSPDAAWISNEKISKLTKEERKIFAPVCPDFIVELKSKSDTIPELQNKMLKWMENGCALAWLLIPEKEEAHIYRSDGSIEIVKGFNKKLSGENILPGFKLDLSILK